MKSRINAVAVAALSFLILGIVPATASPGGFELPDPPGGGVAVGDLLERVERLAGSISSDTATAAEVRAEVAAIQQDLEALGVEATAADGLFCYWILWPTGVCTYTSGAHTMYVGVTFNGGWTYWMAGLCDPGRPDIPQPRVIIDNWIPTSCY